jgi:hypothetical protein
MSKLKNKFFSLKESLTADVVLAGRDPSATFSKMMSMFRTVANAELTVLLIVAEAVLMLHQTNHWIAKGSSSFADHGLYDKLYAQLAEDVDHLGERIVGLGSDAGVDVHDRAAGIVSILQEMYAPHGVAQADALAERSLAAEFFLNRICVLVIKSMTDIGSMTSGLENLLQNFSDNREQAIYHLRRRTS